MSSATFALEILLIRIRRPDEARIATRALRFPRRIVSRSELPLLLRDGEVSLRQQSASLPQACEAPTRARSVREGCLAPWQFLPRALQPVCPLSQSRNKVFCRTHQSDRE